MLKRWHNAAVTLTMLAFCMAVITCFANVKIAKIFHADGIGILSINTCRSVFKTSSSKYAPVREYGKVLPNRFPAIVVYMRIPHSLLPFKMIIVGKVDIGRDVGVVLLYLNDSSRHSLLLQPGCKFGQAEFGEAIFSFHNKCF